MSEIFQPRMELHTQALIAERLNTQHRSLHRHYQAYQLGGDLSLRFLPTLDAALGLNWVHTYHHTGYQNAFLQGRLLLLDDEVGDPFCLLLGLRLNVPGAWTRSQHILLYHAPVEAQLLLSLGRSFFTCGDWTHRIWAQVNLGQGTRGAPYLDSQLSLERQWTSCGLFPATSTLGLLLDYWVGFGHHHLHHHFHGYSRIAYRCAQLGARFTLLYDLQHQSLDITYRYRPYGRNFPSHAHLADLAWTLYF
jgi:hypothetical protein